MKRYVVVDIETTGLSAAKGAEIIEIGVTEIINDTITRNYSRLIKPKNKIPNKIVELTHISNEMVVTEEYIDNVLPKFRKYIGEDYVIAHNAKFDIKFLNYYLELFNLPIITNYICTVDLLKRTPFYQGNNFKLGTACDYYNIKLENAHRAYADTKATAELFLTIRDMNLINEY